MTQDRFKEENILVGFSDIVLIFKRKRLKIIFSTLFCGLAAALYVLGSSPLFMSEATFREKSKTQTETSKSLSLALILGNQEGSENAAISLLKSRKLMEQVIINRGLQAEIRPSGYSFSFFKNIYDNLSVEWAYLTNSMNPSLSDHVDPISIKNIRYDGETPVHLHFLFISDHSFKIMTPNFKEIGIGHLGTAFNGSNFSFTVTQENNENLKGKKFDLKLVSMKVKAQELIKNLQIWSDNSDKSLLKLTFYNPSRKEASAFLNDLMLSYIEYLKVEQKRIGDEQINYLHKRQEEEALKLKQIMEEHALAISSNMTTMESLFLTQQTYTQRLLLIDLELKRLQRSFSEGVVYYDKYADGPDTHVINQILAEIRGYKQQADSIDVALRQMQPEDTIAKNTTFIKQIAEIETIQTNFKEAKNLLAILEQGQSFPADSALIQNPKYNIKDWIQMHQKTLKTGNGEEREDREKKFKAYLLNMLHLFEVEDKLVNGRITHQQNALLDFQGIDLPTADKLYISYSNSLSDIESEILYHQFIIDQMQDKAFEPSSLSSFLIDPVSHDIIVKASDLILRLKDQGNRSQKELDRLKDDLEQQRNFLLMHVKQKLQLLQLREKLYKEKILSLQNTQLDLIHQKVSVLEKHLSDYITNRIENFKQEKFSIEHQQLSLKADMEKMPSKWASEKLIDLHLDMSRKMIEEITKLVESKNISTHLDITQSSPLDKALPPLHPQNSKLIVFALVGSLIGGLLSCGFIVMTTVYKGVPATESNLRMLGCSVAGAVSKNIKLNRDLSDIDLETLRRIIVQLKIYKNRTEGGQSLLLMISKGPDYSHQISLLLSKSGSKVLRIFNDGTIKESEPGLFHYLEGKLSLSLISQGKNYDYIQSEKKPQFFDELLISPRFEHLIQKLKQDYDWIIFVTTYSPCTGEGESLMNLFDHSAVTVDKESIQDLSICFSKERVTFVFS
jgi:tyrosine-protein kinase Etk/Wzc